MKKNRITLTDDILKLVSVLTVREIDLPSDFNNGRYICGLENYSLYGGSYLLEDMSRALGIYDKRIEGSEDESTGVAFDEETENMMYELHDFILKNLIEIENLLHYWSNKGGLTAGTYNTITFQKEN
jgi:hypothetical protein